MIGINELCTDSNLDATALLDQNPHDMGAINDPNMASAGLGFPILEETIWTKVGPCSTAADGVALDKRLYFVHAKGAGAVQVFVKRNTFCHIGSNKSLEAKFW